MPVDGNIEYANAFVARCSDLTGPVYAGDGLYGVVDPAALTRLLITDDVAEPTLRRVLPSVQGGTIKVYEAAARSTALVHEVLGWHGDVATAMVCRDLAAVPERALPPELTLHPLRRRTTDGADGVDLDDAVALAALADPTIEDPAMLAAYLRSLPEQFRFWAAVDEDGAVRATSGRGVFDDEATVIFVNTDPAWRRRGIGEAMTAEALRAAAGAGARRACLDASGAGLAIYRRLGFEPVTGITLFSGMARPG